MADSDAALISVNGDGGGFPPRLVRDAAAAVLHGEGQASVQVGITFLNPTMMRDLNRRFLAHDWPTDVLSFPLQQPDGSLSGDVYLCRSVAARQARDHAVPVRDEILRLVIHGTLHLVGWDHSEGPSRMESAMWQRQELYLASLR